MDMSREDIQIRFQQSATKLATTQVVDGLLKLIYMANHSDVNEIARDASAFAVEPFLRSAMLLFQEKDADMIQYFDPSTWKHLREQGGVSESFCEQITQGCRELSSLAQQSILGQILIYDIPLYTDQSPEFFDKWALLMWREAVEDYDEMYQNDDQDMDNDALLATFGFTFWPTVSNRDITAIDDFISVQAKRYCREAINLFYEIDAMSAMGGCDIFKPAQRDILEIVVR